MLTVVITTKVINLVLMEVLSNLKGIQEILLLFILSIFIIDVSTIYLD